jgi:threonine aldolase
VKPIDLRSDTITLPSPAMRQAILDAKLGDDVFGEDPTVNELEELAASMMGKDAAIFVASGTMGNLISAMVHCRRGEQIILGRDSHIMHWEQCGASTLGGISMRAIPNEANGELKLKDIESAVNGDDLHLSRTKLICLENTFNGHPLSLSYIAEVEELARHHCLNMHLDGARIFNAAIALKVPVEEIAKYFDSVQFCCSKGLAAPVGSVICGSEEFIDEARRVRKMLGGGMRQAGILAAACLVSLRSMIERLEEDHQNANTLAQGLAQIAGVDVRPAKIRTNIVFFGLKDKKIALADFARALKEEGLIVSCIPSTGLRAVTHFGIEASDIHEAVKRVKKAVGHLGAKQSAAV